MISDTINIGDTVMTVHGYGMIKDIIISTDGIGAYEKYYVDVCFGKVVLMRCDISIQK